MTRLDLINMALLKAGVSQTVVTETENTREGLTARKLYDPTRREVLRAYPWAFATRYENLEIVDGDDAPAVQRLDGAVEWQYAYQYPEDCLFARRLVAAGGRRFDRNPLRWRVGRASQNLLVVFTNDVDPMLEYTGDVDLDTTPPEPLFESAFTTLLASRFAMSLSREAKLARELYLLFRDELPFAQTINGREAQPEPDTDQASWHTDR